MNFSAHCSVHSFWQDFWGKWRIWMLTVPSHFGGSGSRWGAQADSASLPWSLILNLIRIGKVVRKKKFLRLLPKQVAPCPLTEGQVLRRVHFDIYTYSGSLHNNHIRPGVYDKIFEENAGLGFNCSPPSLMGADPDGKHKPRFSYSLKHPAKFCSDRWSTFERVNVCSSPEL